MQPDERLISKSLNYEDAFKIHSSPLAAIKSIIGLNILYINKFSEYRPLSRSQGHQPWCHLIGFH